MHFQNERGFTLLEMLFVLMIVGVLSTIVLHFSFEKMQRHTYMKTIRQVELAIRVAQTMAMEEQRVIYCEVREGTNFVIRRDVFGEAVYEQPLPEGMQMQISTARGRIQFQASGNVSQIGRINFSIGDDYVFYTINLGKGRFLLYE